MKKTSTDYPKAEKPEHIESDKPDYIKDSSVSEIFELASPLEEEKTKVENRASTMWGINNKRR